MCSTCQRQSWWRASRIRKGERSEVNLKFVTWTWTSEGAGRPGRTKHGPDWLLRYSSSRVRVFQNTTYSRKGRLKRLIRLFTKELWTNTSRELWKPLRGPGTVMFMTPTTNIAQSTCVSTPAFEILQEITIDIRDIDRFNDIGAAIIVWGQEMGEGGEN